MKINTLKILICCILMNMTIMNNLLAKETVGLVLLSLDGPFYRSIQQGAQQEANKLGYNLIVLDSEKKSLKEQNNVQDLMEKGIKILLIQPTNKSVMQNVITLAKSKQVPVVVLDAGHDNSHVISAVSADSYIGARMAGEFIAARLGEGARIIQLEGPLASSEAAKRNKGFLQAVKQHKFCLLASQPADFDRTKGLNVMQNLLVIHPDVQAVFAQNDEMALGALSALQVAGRTNVLVVGFDGTDDAIKAVESGKLAATVNQQPELLGKTSMMVADKIIKGKSVPSVVTVESKLMTKSSGR